MAQDYRSGCRSTTVAHRTDRPGGGARELVHDLSFLKEVVSLLHFARRRRTNSFSKFRESLSGKGYRRVEQDLQVRAGVADLRAKATTNQSPLCVFRRPLTDSDNRIPAIYVGLESGVSATQNRSQFRAFTLDFCGSKGGDQNSDNAVAQRPNRGMVRGLGELSEIRTALHGLLADKCVASDAFRVTPGLLVPASAKKYRKCWLVFGPYFCGSEDGGTMLFNRM